jgi:hypothetical protein
MGSTSRVAPNVIDTGTRWREVVKFGIRPLCSWERTPVTFELEAVLATELYLTFRRKFSCLYRDLNPGPSSP